MYAYPSISLSDTLGAIYLGTPFNVMTHGQCHSIRCPVPIARAVQVYNNNAVPLIGTRPKESLGHGRKGQHGRPCGLLRAQNLITKNHGLHVPLPRGELSAPPADASALPAGEYAIDAVRLRVPLAHDPMVAEAPARTQRLMGVSLCPLVAPGRGVCSKQLLNNRALPGLGAAGALRRGDEAGVRSAWSREAEAGDGVSWTNHISRTTR